MQVWLTLTLERKIWKLENQKLKWFNVRNTVKLKT